MEINEIRELAAVMKETGMTAIEIKEKDVSIKLKREVFAAPAVKTHAAVEDVIEEKTVPGAFTVKSPMVGVFYSAPGADKEPYVKQGDTVHAGDILCIVEAMKIMNEITAECDGVISEICASNKQVVEFGQPLFRIDTSKV